jgi:gliding motility-associated-like protein
VTTTVSPQLSFAQTTATCGSSNGTATVSITNGIAPSTITWNTSPSQTTATAANLAGNTYTVTVLGANNCSTTASVVVMATVPPQLSLAQTEEICGHSNGTASVSITNSVVVSTITWNTTPPQTTATALGLVANTYTVTVLGANNCSATASIIVAALGTIQIQATAQATTCSGGLGSATVTVLSGAPVPTYLWSGGETTATINNLAAGIYTVTVSQAYNTFTCTASASVTVANLNILPTVTFYPNGSTCGLTNGGTSTTTVNGSPNPLYLWSTGATTSGIANVSAGIYTVTVTNSLTTCSTVSTVTIGNIGTPFTVTTDTTNPCSTNNNGFINTAIVGTTDPMTYLWSNTGTTSSINNLPAGVYTVTATSTVAGSCTATASVTLIPLALPVLTPTIVNTSCGNANGSISVASDIPGTVIKWVFVPNGPIRSNLAAGTYQYGGCSNTCCTPMFTAVVAPSSNDASASFASIPVIYQGNSTAIQATVTPTNATLAWSNGASSNPITVSPMLNSVYTVTVTSPAGCSATASVAVIVNEVKWNIPTVFSPNGDGQNDTYYIVQYGGLEVQSFQIFNRWGVLLHDKADHSWDGKKDGEPQPMDTYVYKVVVKNPDGTTETRTGDFLLVR